MSASLSPLTVSKIAGCTFAVALLWEPSAVCFPTGNRLPFCPSILGSFPLKQSTLLTQPEISAKTLHKSFLCSGKHVWYQQIVPAKRIALRDTLLADIEDPAILCGCELCRG